MAIHKGLKPIKNKAGKVTHVRVSVKHYPEILDYVEKYMSSKKPGVK